MSTHFSIVQIAPEWVLEEEQMGTKDKFWFRQPDDPEERDWLFKIPTAGTGQHWAEKVAWEIARLAQIHAPQVELAEFDGVRGSATLSFTKVRAGDSLVRYELYHGNQILAGMDAAYDPERRFRHTQHTVQRIFRSMDMFPAHHDADRFRETLAEYLVFDALIGNVDRHHENWGVLRKRFGDRWRGRLAPSFDHASSLGRELRDEGGKQNRHRYLNELGVEVYMRRARGAVFTDEASRHAPSPLELVRWCLADSHLGAFFAKAVEKISRFDPESLHGILAQMPPGWMTDLEREFVLRLVSANHKQLYRMQP
jgi:hypothetical protein